MQQSKPKPDPKTSNDPFIVVFEAETPAEAVVLRSLLESAGIESPQPTFTDPFPFGFSSVLARDTSVLARESQSEDARLLIASKSEEGGE